MIAALLLALQLAAADSGAPATLIVRNGAQEGMVPLVRTAAGPMLEADRLAPVLPVSVKTLTDGQYVLVVPGAEITVTAQVPFARVRGDVVPLASAPTVYDGALFVPLQLVAEVVPRYATGLIYDGRRTELRAFAPQVAHRGSASGAAAERGGAPPEGSRPRREDTATRVVPGARARDSASGRAAAASATPRSTSATASAPASAPASAARGAPPNSEDTAAPAPARHPSPARATTAVAPRRPAPRRERRLIIVDAGHGGPDRGMHGPIGRGPRVIEKDVTLAVAKRLGAELRARGFDVLFTRTTDTLIALADRGRIANQAHGDVFISVHVNAANPNWKDPGAARGFETYFLAEAKTEDARRVEAMENESVRFETGAYAPRGDPLNFVITDMAQNEHLRESSDLAATIQGDLAKIHPGPDRGVRQANFAVLRGSYMPAVLVEIGFGTNPRDAAFITSARRQRQIADAIADATVEYMRRYERRVGQAGR